MLRCSGGEERPAMEKQRQRKVNNRSGIVICGSYGLGNAGDESILKAILQEVRTVAPCTRRSPSSPATRRKQNCATVSALSICLICLPFTA